MNGLDKNYLFREPTVFREQGRARFLGQKGPSAGQMVQQAIEQEKRGWCPHCNTINGHVLTCERAASSRPLPKAKPNYSLGASLLIWAVVFMSIAVGLALVLTTGGR